MIKKGIYMILVYLFSVWICLKVFQIILNDGIIRSTLIFLLPGIISFVIYMVLYNMFFKSKNITKGEEYDFTK